MIKQPMPNHHHAPDHPRECLVLPAFERVKYFYGQLLGVREFQSEQSYFREKHRLHNRYLHGYGVVCGLTLRRCHEPPAPCPEPKPARPSELCVEVECGLALDCCGNEVVLPWPAKLNLLARLSCDERDRVLEGTPLYVYLSYAERPLEPVRPLSADGCGGLVPDCVPSRVGDHFCLRVSLERMEHDATCSACHRPCDDPRLLLAEVRYCEGELRIKDLRRALGLYVPTRIDGISWVHGATYHAAKVDEMLAHGLEIHFDNDVHGSTLRAGVVDVWIIQGGGGRRGDVYNADIEIIPKLHDQFTRQVTLRLHPHHRDRIDPGDRVLIQLRSAFVLDRCCRPLDGEHVGGQVPVLPEFRDKWEPTTVPPGAPCRPPEPYPCAAWTSGNGAPGGTFESWFFVADDGRKG
jgi:hypothetical protein